MTDLRNKNTREQLSLRMHQCDVALRRFDASVTAWLRENAFVPFPEEMYVGQDLSLHEQRRRYGYVV
jgi:hypothetical protein